MAYGVVPTGFRRKPLTQILSEIEESATLAFAQFGETVIQTPESPMGQLNGFCASLIDTAWATAEDVYQSYDPDQAEGVRLEQLGRIRLMERLGGEGDAAYRQAITNAGTARIETADIRRALLALDGVSYAQVFINPTAEIDAEGLPPNSIAVAVLGGSDSAVGRALYPFVVPGITAYGNRKAEVTIDGYCRTIYFLRPAQVRMGLYLNVRVSPDRLGCPPPSTAAIAAAAANGLIGDNRPINGRDIDLHLIRTALARSYDTVEVVSAMAFLPPSTTPVALPYALSFGQIANVDPEQIIVALV